MLIPSRRSPEPNTRARLLTQFLTWLELPHLIRRNVSVARVGFFPLQKAGNLPVEAAGVELDGHSNKEILWG